MQTVGIKNLKNDLSRYIRAAKSGETVLVTDRGHIVAQLVPPHVVPDRHTNADLQLAELVKRGIAHPPAIAPGTRVPRCMPVMTIDELLDEIAADKEDR